MAELHRRSDRLRSGAGVALIHALLGYALLTGLGIDVPRRAGASLKLFDVTAPPPRPEEPVRPEPRRDRAEGEASPASAPLHAPTSSLSTWMTSGGTR